ncbi:MAG: glycosyltransferase family 39 protein [Hyphomonadaceae bacterium]|nr:glycosyltransferase family 39 protein [Hyphomonadaceae bacterium]
MTMASGEANRLSLRDMIIVVAFALVALAPGISWLPPMDRDESRYAVASAQMQASGDYVDIRFQDKPRYLQPAGIYWLQSASASLFDARDEIWAYRLPSLLGALAAVLMTAWAGTALFGRNVGIAAGLMLAASFSLNFEARTAKTDAALLASIAAAQFALLRVYLNQERTRGWAALFWAALGVGMMLKGPIIVMIAGATILALIIWDRRAGWLKGLHAGWGALLFLAIVLPWYVAIGFESDGEFYARAVGVSLLGKVGHAQQSHAGPPGYHLGLFPFAFWPASLFAALAIPFVWRKRREPAVRFMIAWIVPTWVIFEAIATKLPHYVLPTYPALACLGAAALFLPDDAKPTRVGAVARALWIAIWVAASAGVAGLGPVALSQLAGRIDAATIGASVIVFALAMAALVFTLQKRAWRAVACAAAAGALAWVNVFANVAPRLERIWISPRLEAAVRAAAPCPQPVLTTNPFIEPSLVFLHGSAATKLAETPEEAVAAFAGAGECAVAAIGAAQKEAFVAGLAARGIAVREAGIVRGQNYSNGDALELTLYVAAR